MAPGLKDRGFLDPEDCWKKWITLGSLGLVRKAYAKEEKINSKTGNPPTKSAIEKAAYMWALDHLKEARKDLEFAWVKDGHILTDEAWNKFLVKAAHLVHYQRMHKFENFVNQHGLQQYV